MSLYPPQESFSFTFLFSRCCPPVRFYLCFPRSTRRRSGGNADSWIATSRSRCLKWNLLVHCPEPSRYQLKFSSLKTPYRFWAKNSAVLCVTVFSSGIVFISIFIFLLLSFNSFFIFVSQINMKEERWKCRFLDCHTQIKVCNL